MKENMDGFANVMQLHDW